MLEKQGGLIFLDGSFSFRNRHDFSLIFDTINYRKRRSNFKKRVAIVCFSRSLGGLELSTLRLAGAMVKKSVPTFIIVPRSSPLEYRARLTSLNVLTITPQWKYGDLGAVISLARALKKNWIDVVLLMQSQNIHMAVLASIVSPRSKLIFYQEMQSRYNKRDFIHSWMYSKLSLWITLTRTMKNDVLACTRMRREKVKVVPLGIDVHRFDPAKFKKTEARTSFNLPKKGYIIGVIGRLDKLKGQHVLLHSIPEILKKHPDVVFLIAGDETAGKSGYKEHLKELCWALDIERSVKFIPFTDDVPRLLAALDVFVLPSFSETFGFVVLEAMAMQKPVIATDAGGVPEIISNDKTGLLVQPNNVDALTRAIHRILRNTALRSSLARSPRAEVLKRFNFNYCVDTLMKLFASV